MHILLRFWVLVLATAATISAIPAFADQLEYRVLFTGDDRGHIKVDRDGNRMEIDYDYKQNGRGPTFTEILTIDDNGYPVSWRVSGRTTFGNPVEESFDATDGGASWRDATGEGIGTSDTSRFYVSQYGSPFELGLLANAILNDDDRAIDLWPGGVARAKVHDTRTFEGTPGAMEVRIVEITGPATDPAYVAIDQQGDLFAVLSPRAVFVRKGYESADEMLRAYAEQLGAERFTTIQAEAAHNYDGPVRVRNVRVFDPATLQLGEPRDVIFNGRHISAVLPAGSVASAGETQIDGAGGSLVPGLFEMHAHLGQDRALLGIVAGITSVRDIGNENDVLDKLIERIGAGEIAGPRIFRSAFIEGQSEFSAATGETVSTEAEALEQVRWAGARGYQFVKLYNSMTPAWAPALTAEAHDLGMRVAGHVPAFSSADAMIDAGFDEITHINQLMLGWVLNEGEDTRTLFRFTAMRRFPDLDLDGPLVQSTLDKMARRGVAHDPTIAIHELGLTAIDGEVQPHLADVYDHLPIGTQRGAKQALFGTDTDAERQQYIAAYETILETLRRMHAKGIMLVPGTDLGGSFAYHRELELFGQIGMTPAEVLRRASYDMAVYLGQDQMLGTIEKGKYADFFLVPGDPTQDLNAIKTISMVVSDGTVYFPEEVYPYFGIRPFVEAPEVSTASE